MSDTLTPGEVSRIYLIECHECDERLYTDGLTTLEVAAWAGSHDHDVEVHFHDDMGLVPTRAVVS